jgi:membrane associated rhomboid family serine protease
MITIAILILTIGFSLITMNNPQLKYKYLFHPYSVYHFNQHYRFLSHAFLHADFLHLAFNMYALWIFGPVVEKEILPILLGTPQEPNFKLGMVMYIVLYTGAIYASSIYDYIKNKNNESYSSLGASGAVNALIFSYIACLPFTKLGFFFIPMPAWVFGAVYLGISYYLSKRRTGNSSVDNIAHDAHFWGAIFGLLFTVTLGLLNKEVYFSLITFLK